VAFVTKFVKKCAAACAGLRANASDGASGQQKAAELPMAGAAIAGIRSIIHQLTRAEPEN
jgi:hypothetical protein